MKIKKYILMFLVVTIFVQTPFGINSYAKTYNSCVSLPSTIVSNPNIEEYVDGEILNAYINGERLKLFVAKERDTIIKGLSGINKIPFDGMIFLFGKARKISFWMKDMKFSLDIVWVQNNVIVGVTENIKPEPGVPVERLKTYPSPTEVDTVIELSAGRAKQLNIKEGNILILEHGD
ncbi:MAG: DUF192 domain-containing protein [Endomicrobium sp.]|jgi:uncharacterized membrane protein (UPF0127 family)|nr:DUF192 domain-containing protein [Endomicrobium sp.]